MGKKLRVMTLNLHTYQEIESSKYESLEVFFDAYKRINEIIAKTIKEKEVDIICFQEAAQHKDMPIVMKIGDVNIRKHNVILDIQLLLKEKYNQEFNFIWDWSHYGWDVWEEGVGILTKFDIEQGQANYVSTVKSVNDIHGRKVIKGGLSLPEIKLDVYSGHFNWWEKGFKVDIDNLFNWMSESSSGKNFILAGDFNNAAGDLGYDYLMTKTINNQKIIDVDYAAHKDNFYRPTIRGDYFNLPQRIDYIFTNDVPNIIVENSECIFTDENDGERVSDHMGVVADLRIRKGDG